MLVALDLVMRLESDCIPERSEELQQDSIGVRFAVRLNSPHDLSEDTVKCCRIHLRPHLRRRRTLRILRNRTGCWTPIWKRSNKRFELFAVVPTIQPSRNVALRQAVRPDGRDVEHPNACSYAIERFCNAQRVLTPGLIIVGKQNDVSTAEYLVVGCSPLAGAAGTGRCF